MVVSRRWMGQFGSQMARTRCIDFPRSLVDFQDDFAFLFAKAAAAAEQPHRELPAHELMSVVGRSARGGF